MTGHGLIEDIRWLLDTFQTGYWSQDWIPGNDMVVSRDLNVACEAVGTMTDEEVETCLFAEETDWERSPLEMLQAREKVPQDQDAKKDMEILYQKYLNALKRTWSGRGDPPDEVLIAAGELMEEVLSRLSLASLI